MRELSTGTGASPSPPGDSDTNSSYSWLKIGLWKMPFSPCRLLLLDITVKHMLLYSICVVFFPLIIICSLNSLKICMRITDQHRIINKHCFHSPLHIHTRLHFVMKIPPLIAHETSPSVTPSSSPGNCLHHLPSQEYRWFDFLVLHRHPLAIYGKYTCKSD